MVAGDPTVEGASWYAASVVPGPARAPLRVDLDVDACVIGGGLAGLTAARELARRGWSVALLEGGRVGRAASGRNTGFVLPGFASDAETLIARVGREHASELWALSETGLEYVRTTIRETRMPGVEYVAGGWLHVSKTGDAGVAEYAELLNGAFGAGVEHWPADRVRAALPSPLYFGAVHYPRAFTIHPFNYALGLAAAAEAAGVRIFEETSALEIDPAGVRKRIVTPSARVRANRIVLACNVDVGPLMPGIAGTLVPISTYVIVTAPLGDALRQAILYRGAVSDTELASNHYRVVGGDRLMWSGRSTTWRRNPSRYVGPLLDELRRAYPQFEDATAEHVWTGTLGNTVHRMPQIGELAPGIWLLSGFGGHGLNTTAMGGELVARSIAESDDRWRLFSPFELVWAGGRLGRAALSTYAWGFRKRERFDNWLALRRERRRPQAPPDAAEPEAPSVVPAEAEPAAESQAARRRLRKGRGKTQKKAADGGQAADAPAADALPAAAEAAAPAAPAQAPEPKEPG